VGTDALLALPSAFSHIHHLAEEIFGVHMEAPVNSTEQFLLKAHHFRGRNAEFQPYFISKHTIKGT
jgi:hypothetical protein